MLPRFAWLGLTCLAVWIWLVTAAGARDIFVDNVAGDDHAEGSRARTIGGTGGPVATISKALRLAAAGDRVVLANTGQPYRESISLSGSRHSASEIAPFIIEGGGAVLDGSASVPADAWTHETLDVFSFRPARLGYQQLFLRGKPALRHPASSGDVSPPLLEPFEWCLWDGKIMFRVEPGRLPADYDLACCGLQTGVTLYYIEGVVVRDLTVQGFQIDGISAHDVVRGATFERVTCRGNGRSGLSVGGSSRIELDHCRLGNNGHAQLHTEGYSATRVYDTKLIANTAPAIEHRGGEVTIDGTPLASRKP